MKYPLFDLESQYRALQERIDARIARVMPSLRFVLGPEVTRLESELAAFTGAGHAISVANGTDALIVALLAAGVGPGDAVFVPSFTFVATAGAVANTGATPVFVDVEEHSFNMDPAHLGHCIDEVARGARLRPRAVIPVDLFGLPADYPAIRAVAAEHGMVVIADAAQSLGAELGGRRVGTLADMTATSFYPTKPLGCYGDGGCLFTDDDRLAERIRLIRTHGLDGSGQAIRIGLNSRLDTLQAAVLLAKLEVFDEELVARNDVAAAYEAGLGGVARTPGVPETLRSARAVYTIRIRERDRIRSSLGEQGVGTGVYYAAGLHLQPAYSPYGHGAGSLPVTERLSGEVLSLPMSPYLSRAAADEICGLVVRAAA